MNPSLILLFILTIVRLWIAIQLFLTARRSKLTDLYWLVGVFVLAIYSLFTPLTGSPLGNPWIFNLGVLAGHFCLAMFIHTTFYQGRKSPIKIVLGLIVLVFCVDVYLLSVNSVKLATAIAGVGLVNWIWHYIIAQSAYSAIAADPSVEKWVKARYRLMLVYVVMITLSSINVVLSNTALAPFIPSFLTPLSILLLIGSIILQFLVWVMPEPFRLWLNCDQQARAIQEQQRSLSVLDVFGVAMITGTGLKSIACLYAIRAAVSKRIGSDDSAAVRKHLDGMTYQEWEAVFQHAELRRILINGGADNSSADRAIQNARQTLVEKQSLLTLGVR